jgi:hypothetical protein
VWQWKVQEIKKESADKFNIQTSLQTNDIHNLGQKCFFALYKNNPRLHEIILIWQMKERNYVIEGIAEFNDTLI